MEGCELCGNHAVEANGKCASCNRLLRKLEKAEHKRKEQELKIRQRQQQARKQSKPAIKKVSGKMAALLAQYTAKRRVWIKGKICAVLMDRPATDVHHKMGRVGYADDWAREHDVPLLLDERFWLPVSREGHTWVETHPAEAKENGFSLNRL